MAGILASPRVFQNISLFNLENTNDKSASFIFRFTLFYIQWMEKVIGDLVPTLCAGTKMCVKFPSTDIGKLQMEKV